MRLARLVAAGLVLGALAGFLSALVRPRSVPGATSASQPEQPDVVHLPDAAGTDGRGSSTRGAAPDDGTAGGADHGEPALAGLPGAC